MRVLLIAISFCLAMAFATVIEPRDGYAQSSRELNNRLNRLEKELQTLNRAVYKGEAPPPSLGAIDDPASAADAEVRLQQLEIELRDIRGLMEQQDNDIRQLKNQMERALSDIELRLGSGSAAQNNVPYTANGTPVGADEFAWNSKTGAYNGSTNAGGAGAGIGAQANDVNTPNTNTLGVINPRPLRDAGSAADTPAARYEDAFAMVRNGRYNAAQKAFQSFIDDYPGHALVSNAYYWLGETHYVRGDYQSAVQVFAQGYKKFPRASKAPDNLLKLGLSLARMDKPEDACVALGQLVKDYKAGAQPVIRRAKQEISRLNCG